MRRRNEKRNEFFRFIFIHVGVDSTTSAALKLTSTIDWNGALVLGGTVALIVVLNK